MKYNIFIFVCVKGSLHYVSDLEKMKKEKLYDFSHSSLYTQKNIFFLETHNKVMKIIMKVVLPYNSI